MNRIARYLGVASILIGMASITTAQVLEEVVVTGIYDSEHEVPGVVYQRKADYLLMRVTISNDTRDEAKRSEEIYATIKSAIKTAEKNARIELSYLQDDLVLPLTLTNHKLGLSKGERPDTSKVHLQIKTAIREKDKDAGTLIENLKDFVKKLPVEGRVEIISDDDITVSVVGPGKYRKEIVALIQQDVALVTQGLGEGYKVILEDVYLPVKYRTAGALHVGLYIPYRYTVVPNNIQSFMAVPEY